MEAVSVEMIQGGGRSRRSLRVDPAQVRQVERCSRAIANTTVQALDSVQATTSPTQVRTDRLTAAGLVARQESTGDRREIRLVLTPMGHRSVGRFVESRVAIIARTMGSMRASDRMALLRGLKAFSAATETSHPQETA